MENADFTAVLTPPRLVLFSYASANGADAQQYAAVLGLKNTPKNAASAWEQYATADTYPPLEFVCEEYGLDDFARFAVNLALSAELDEAICAALAALGGGLTAGFALRLFAGLPEEAVTWRARWLANKDKLCFVFTEPETLKLNPAVLRFLLGAADKETLPRCLDRLASVINAAFVWDDLILPVAQKNLLRHICDRVRFDETVYGDWGFGKIVPYGRGVRALFSGSPGTGKTMAAQIIAAEIGMRLYRVDLSALVSKYIGETEKNIDEVFTEAEKSGGILFFDEADALFGKRGEQKDSHDKYANMQTAFLLQRVEDYDGIVLLATNFVSNLDAAFTRRIQIRVDFPAPDEVARFAIWRSLLKSPAPTSDDMDLAFLARRFDLTGAEIKNIVLAAAFLAAAEGAEEKCEAITMRHAVRALAMEYAKTNKILSANELGEYAGDLE
jgi:hypothetical protein